MARKRDPRQRYLAQFQLPSGRWNTDSAWSTLFDAASYVWLVIDAVPNVTNGRVYDAFRARVVYQARARLVRVTTSTRRRQNRR